MNCFVGIDIGGTFTDCAVLDEDGTVVTIAKSPTRRDDPVTGVMGAIAAAAANMDLDQTGLLSKCRFLIHGCTVATNAVVERSGVPTGLITTRGHEDALFIGKVMQKVAGSSEREMIHQSRLDMADPPLIRRAAIRGVTERLDRTGSVVVKLDREQLDRAIDGLVSEGVKAIAVSLLWSFLNPDHERLAKRRIAERHPGIFVSASHELAPMLGEYERTATTALSAYVGPGVAGYLERLSERLADAGYAYPMLVAQCMGGLTTVDEIRTKPLLTLDSGPVSGVLGARFFGEVHGERNIICTDMGGTTFDVSLIENGRYVMDEAPVIDKYTYLVPKIAVESIGAGGGSIVWRDDHGLLRVGPESAGAEPGPACYGRGGDRLTITDVDLLLGFLDADAFLGGAMKLDRDAAERAAEALASGLTRVGIADGAFRIVNAHMADLIRRTSVDRGRDPREFVLFAYGGAGAMHIAYLARELRIAEVCVPLHAAVFSALGMLTGEIRHGEEASCPVDFPLSVEGAADLDAAFAAMRKKLDALLDAEAVPPADRTFARSLHLKFRLQPTALAVEIPCDWNLSERDADIVADFVDRYEAMYGPNTSYRAAGIEVVKCRLEASAGKITPRLLADDEADGRNAEAAYKSSRPVYFPEIGDYADTRIYDGARLSAGMSFSGPGIVERMGDTIVIPSFAQARIDGYGNVRLAIPPPAERETP